MFEVGRHRLFPTRTELLGLAIRRRLAQPLTEAVALFDKSGPHLIEDGGLHGNRPSFLNPGVTRQENGPGRLRCRRTMGLGYRAAGLPTRCRVPPARRRSPVPAIVPGRAAGERGAPRRSWPQTAGRSPGRAAI